MPAAPKTQKKDKRREEEQRKKDLQEYRRVQSALAIERDGSLCVFCFFLHGKRTPRSDVHHTFGRGDTAGDPREHYTNLLCVCRECHPPPIITGGSPELDYIERVRKQANETPINRRFGQ